MERLQQQIRPSRCFRLITSIGIVSSLLFIFYSKTEFHSTWEILKNFTERYGETRNYLNNSKLISRNTNSQPSKLILLKNHINWPWYEMAVEELKSCSANCTLLKPRRNISNVQAVIFYAVGFEKDSPPHKEAGQVWVYFCLESPDHSSDFNFNRAPWKNVINWTMTYRRDSEVTYFYGALTKREKKENFSFLPSVKNKTKQVAWFVSHCGTPSKREQYVQQLKKYISIDVFGMCGNKKCGRNEQKKCNSILSRDYKFYLSFENSLCNDYITEKAFGYMQLDIVIVVRGGANYSQILPPKSYINAADFKSPKQLAEYLLYLDRNVTAYVEYLEWKNYYKPKKNSVGICKLCHKLWESSKQTKVYHNVYDWWHNNTCYTPKDLV